MEKTLLILAAGMGSRFKGLKQIEPVGPSGEFIIDYSIYDAIRNGFTKVVFVIKKDIYDIFRDTIGKRVEDKIKVEYVFQELDNLPVGYSAVEGRISPWGTGHAVLCAKDVINEPFAIINADDFYGNDAFKIASEYIDSMDNLNSTNYGLVCYDLINTTTENGSVKRGVCEIKDGYLSHIEESKAEIIDGELHVSSLETNEEYIAKKDTKVSMSMFVLTPSIFNYFETNFKIFLDNNKDPLKGEYFMPTTISKGIDEGFCKVKVINTSAKWVGVTYREDKDLTVEYIENLVEQGVYKQNLWN